MVTDLNGGVVGVVKLFDREGRYKNSVLPDTFGKRSSGGSDEIIYNPALTDLD